MSILMADRIRRLGEKFLPLRLKDLILGHRFRSEATGAGSSGVSDYWTVHTVGVYEEALKDRDASRAFFEWRCDQYPGYLDLMPVAGHDGERVLDYGCGPGHDLVGFLEHSNPAMLVGADVSSTALDFARRRLPLHPSGDRATLMRVTEQGGMPELEDASFDYIHCSGVLHHVTDPLDVLREFRRLLAPNGRIRLMVYNRDSIWRNFYVPYVLQQRRRAIDPSLSLDDAFTMSTDGPDCPIARSYDLPSITRLATEAGLDCRLIGTAISNHEVHVLQKYRSAALKGRRTDPAVRAFAESFCAEESGSPVDAAGMRPGINLVVELSRAAGDRGG